MNRASRDHKFGARCEIPAYTYASAHRDGAEVERREKEREREREGDAVARTHLRTQTRAKRVNI